MVGIIIWIASSLVMIGKKAAEITVAQSIGRKDLDKAKDGFFAGGG